MVTKVAMLKKIESRGYKPEDLENTLETYK